MPYIRLIDEDDAEGCSAEYDAALRRAGKVFNVVKAMSPNPQVLRTGLFGNNWMLPA